jgi:hypothetical protein
LTVRRRGRDVVVGGLDFVGGSAGVGEALRGAVVTIRAGAAAFGAGGPCALARRLSPTTMAVSAVITRMTRCLIGVTT